MRKWKQKMELKTVEGAYFLRNLILYHEARRRRERRIRKRGRIYQGFLKTFHI
jgi:hypothetical protein